MDDVDRGDYHRADSCLAGPYCFGLSVSAAMAEARPSSDAPTLVDDAPASPTSRDVEKGAGKVSKTEAASEDTHIISFGANDPEDPRQWSYGKRICASRTVQLA